MQSEQREVSLSFLLKRRTCYNGRYILGFAGSYELESKNCSNNVTPKEP